MAKKRHQSLRSDRDARQRKKPKGGEGWAEKLLQEMKASKAQENTILQKERE